METCESSIVVRSYAKVNLTLDVLGVRPDGYHAIESVMQTISLHDTVTLRLTDAPGIRLTCDVRWIPTDVRNLAYRAADVLLERHGAGAGVEVGLDKLVPAQAGLGGGSSNAAAVLRGLDRLLMLSLPAAELCELGARVGSDVPFFISGGRALVRGRGEQIDPLPDAGEWWLVVVKPMFGVSTAWAYRRLDEMPRRELRSYSRRMLDCACSLSPDCIGDLLGNDLEAPAIEQHPAIGRIKRELLRLGACASLMCGSGSAVFGLFPDEARARSCAGSIGPIHGEAFVARTLSREESIRFDL